MAFGREMRMVLSFQSHGQGIFRNAQRDIANLERSAKAANLNQLAVQKQIVTQAQQYTRLQDTIATAEAASINKRIALQARAAKAEERFASRRSTIANKEVALANAVSAKTQQIRNSAGRVHEMAGSGMGKFAPRENALATQRLRIEQQINGVSRTGLGLEAQALRANANRLASRRKLLSVTGGAAGADRLLGDPAALGRAGTRTRELAYRYQAVLKDIKKIEMTQKALSGQTAIYNSQLEGVLAQEKLIKLQKFEQAAAIGRQVEAIGLQEAQLAQIVARQAEIEAAVAAIDREEATVNVQLGEQLRLLEDENVQLMRSRVLLGEIGAELARNKGIRMSEAVAADAANMQQMKRHKQQTVARSITHGGTFAALAGGIGVGIGAGLAAGYANFNRQATRAATQLRGTNELIGTAAITGKKLETVIIGLSKSFPATMTEMADSAYELASGMDIVGKTVKVNGKEMTLAATGAERLKVTTELLAIANRVAVAGGIDLKSATDSMIVTLNNFGPTLDGSKGSIDAVNKVMNTLFATVKYGKGGFDEFAPVFGKMSAGAKVANQSLKDAGGAVAFLSQKMASQAQAVVGYTNLLQVMQRKEFRAGFKAMFGVSEMLPGTNKMRPLQQIIAMMIKARPELTKGGAGLANLISDITTQGDLAMGANKSKGLQGNKQARTALAQLIIGWKNYASTLRNVRVNVDEFEKSYNLMNQSPGVRWQIAINQFKAFAIILGQEALPVMLRFMSYVQGLVRRFEGLSKHTRHLIITIALFTAGLTLVSGVVAILVGGIGSLITRLTFMSGKMTAARTASGKLLVTLTALSRLAAIGIAIGVTYYVTNKPFREKVQKKFLEFDQKTLNEAHKEKHNVHGFLARAFKSPIEVLAALDIKFRGAAVDRQEIERRRKQLASQMGKFGDKSVFGLTHIGKDNKKVTDSIYNDWAELTANLTGLDYLKGASLSTVKNINNIQLALAKAQSTGNQPAINAAAKKQIASDDKAIARYEKIKKPTQAQSKYLLQLYQDRASMLGLLTTQQNKDTAATTKSTKAHDRAAKALENAKTKVTNLKNRIEELNQTNLDQLQSAFGSLFQGPIMQGPIAQVFTDLNSTLAGFGAKPIPIPISLVLQDQASQADTFTRFNKDLGILTQRVLKASPMKNKKHVKTFADEFSKQVLGMGASTALPFLEGILHGTGKQQKQVITNFIKNQKLIMGAAKSPWNTQLLAANIQLRAAKAQLHLAQGKVGKAKHDIAAHPKTTTRKPSGTTRTLSVYHGDTINVHPQGSAEFARWAHRRDFTRRTKGNRR